LSSTVTVISSGIENIKLPLCTKPRATTPDFRVRVLILLVVSNAEVLTEKLIIARADRFERGT
jgi:hypothetical protein